MTDNLTLFVYGSLRPGMPLWNSWLEPTALEVYEDASTLGALWMTKDSSYPWLTKGPNEVTGTLVAAPLDENLKRLIEMEIGAGYRLEPIEVNTGHETGLAMTFRYPSLHEDFVLVPGQDWSKWMAFQEPRAWTSE